MATNPNWPVVETSWCPGTGAAGGYAAPGKTVDLTDRTTGSIGTQRGRQYELDQVQAGTLSATFMNPDGALDPLNTGGPWAGHIAPYQSVSVRMQYPATINLLTQLQASGGDYGGFPAGTALDSDNTGVYTRVDSTGGVLATSPVVLPGSGGSVFQYAVPASAPLTPDARLCYVTRNAARPGRTYTMQLQVRNATASTTLALYAFIGWYGTDQTAPATYTYGTVQTLTGSTSAGWTQLTVTATAPASVYGMAAGVALAAVPAAACTAQVDGLQLEVGASASAYTLPGVTYPVYAGFTERWPSTWDNEVTYGVVKPTGVDAFALLSQVTLSDPLTEEINNRNPRFLYKLDDPSSSKTFADSTGNYPPAPIESSKAGAATIAPGTSITATNTTTGTYTGSSGTVTTWTTSSPGSPNQTPLSVISLSDAGIKGPTNPKAWTRMVAFRYTGPAITGGAVLWSSFGWNDPGSAAIVIELNTSGMLQLTTRDINGTIANFTAAGGTNCADGNWHLALVTFDIANGWLQVCQDGIQPNEGYDISPTGNSPFGLVVDSIGGLLDNARASGGNWGGDISFVAEFPTPFYENDITAIYGAWKNSFAGDSTDARYQRILNWAGYQGNASLQPGLTTNMGPAATDGQDALSALQDVVDTENGAHFVDRSGTVVFQSRAARYNATVPAYVFGERGDLGEWPYEDIALDYDSTHLGNVVQVTQAETSQVFTATDAVSIAAYFPRTLTRTVNSASSGECQDAASYLLSRYRQPQPRVDSIKLHPGANPALWPVCLSLELGTRIRVMRRPFGAPPIQLDLYVENITWTFDDQNDAWLELQCSPADTTPYAIFGSLHTTLAVQATAGATSITIQAGADNQNPLAAQIGQGQQIKLEPGSTNAETATVLSVGATSPGWTTGVITLSAALAKTHAAGTVMSELLPTGDTNPAQWDGSCQFNSTAFAY